MAQLTVIEGGVRAGDPPPIVWNRVPADGARRALIIRDAPDPREPIVAAWDDGRAFLIGIRAFRLPADEKALAAWISAAKADGVPVVDQRDPNALQGSVTTSQALELARRTRDQRRRSEPLPAGGLFDLVQRDQGDLFR